MSWRDYRDGIMRAHETAIARAMFDPHKPFEDIFTVGPTTRPSATKPCDYCESTVLAPSLSTCANCGARRDDAYANLEPANLDLAQAARAGRGRLVLRPRLVLE